MRRDLAILARTARVVAGREGTYKGERGGFDLPGPGMPMADVTVLLTCAGPARGHRARLPGRARRGAHRGRVLVSDLDPLSPALFAADAVVDLPPVADPGYGAAVAEACAAEGVRAVLPLTDLDPVVLAEAAPRSSAARRRASSCPTRRWPSAARTSGLCHEILARPRAALAADLAARARPTRHALPYPVLFKPRLGFAGRHIYRCADRRRARPSSALLARSRASCSGPLPGREFSIDCLGDLDGRALGAIPRAMIQSKGGEQIKGETLDDPQLVELGARPRSRPSACAGPSTVQCFREDGDGPRHHGHQHALRRRVPAAPGRRGRLPGADRRASPPASARSRASAATAPAWS